MAKTIFPLALLALGACIQPLYESGSTGGNTGGASTNSGSNGSTGSAGSTTGSVAISATRRAPEVMFLVDKSGSMTDPAAAGQSTSKWQDLVNVMTGQTGVEGYVEQLQSALDLESGEPSLIGLVTFPSDPTCGPGVVQVAPAANASQTIDEAIQSQSPGGGTPTAASFDVAAQGLAGPDSAGRDQFIILLTDGTPNCNLNWSGSADACQENTPQCTSAGCCYSGGTPTSSCSPEGCLDDANTINTLKSLTAQGVETFVIGFGADVADPSSAAGQTLAAMAQAGGSGTLYSATDSASLDASLWNIGGVLQNRCGFALAQAAPAQFSSVTLANGTNTQSIVASHVTVSADRLHLLIDDAACSGVPGHAVTLTFQ